MLCYAMMCYAMLCYVCYAQVSVAKPHWSRSQTRQLHNEVKYAQRESSPQSPGARACAC